MHGSSAFETNGGASKPSAGEGVSDEPTDDDLKRQIAQDNERSKLEATALNNIAVAVVVAGVIAPVFSVIYNLSTKPNLTVPEMIGAAAAWLSTAYLTHRVGKSRLRNMR